MSRQKSRRAISQAVGRAVVSLSRQWRKKAVLPGANRMQLEPLEVRKMLSYAPLSGTYFSSTPYVGNVASNAFDNNSTTAFVSSLTNGANVGIDLGVGNAASISQIKYWPRAGYASRMLNGIFQGSNDGTNYTTVATITTTPSYAWNTITSGSSVGYRYFRYVGPTGTTGDVADLEFDSSLSPGAPAAPANLAYSLDATGTQVNLTWTDAGPSSSETSYIVERMGNGVNVWTHIATLAAGSTSYSDSSLPLNRSYVYRVRATDSSGDWLASNQLNVTTGGRPVLLTGTPFGFAGSSATTRPENAFDGSTSTSYVAYGAANGVVGIDLGASAPLNQIKFFPKAGVESSMNGGIFKGSNDGVTYTTIYTISGTPAAGWNTVNIDPNSNIDNPTNSWRYIEYVGSSTTYGTVSEIQFYSSAPNNAPAAPANLTATAVSSQEIDLNWTDPDTTGAVTNYVVERRQGIYGTWTQLASLLPSATSFADTTTYAAGNYTYRVRAIDANGDWLTTGEVAPTALGANVLLGGSAFASGSSLNPGYAFDGDTSTTFTGSGPNGAYVGIDLGAGNARTISQISFYPASGYAGNMTNGLFQGSNDGTNYTTVASVGSASPSPGWTTLSVNGAAAYRYLRYLGASGSYAKVTDLQFYTATSTPAAPSNLTATPTGSSNSLSWSASANATSYNVYRSTTTGGEGATPIATGITGTSWTDSSPVSGTTNYYQVTAVNSVGPSSRSIEKFVIRMSGSTTATAGTAYNPSFPNLPTSITSLTINWGDSNTSIVSPSGSNFAIGHYYAVAGNYTITATASDATNQYAVPSLGLAITTPATVSTTPVITGANSVPQGGTYTLNFNAPTPSGVSITGWQINWGDGGTPLSVGNVSSATHVFTGVSSFDIQATVTYSNGQSATASLGFDITVGDQGVIVTPYAAEASMADAVAIQPNGDIVVVGRNTAGGTNYSVTRYLPNGQIDTSFGTNGSVSLNISTSDTVALHAQILTDSKILISGFSTDTTSGPYNSLLTIERLNSDGSVDTSFNGGNKLVTNLVSHLASNALLLNGTSDAFYVFGAANPNISGQRGNMLIESYDANGNLVGSFGGIGSVDTGLSSYIPFNATLQGNGQILTGGWVQGGPYGFSYVLSRYNADGSRDTTFGTNGSATISNLDVVNNYVDNAFVLQGDGKIVVTGNVVTAAASPNVTAFTIFRFTANGQLDTTFNGTGSVQTSIPGQFMWVPNLAVEPDGTGGYKILSAGYSPTGSGYYNILRLNNDGSSDSTFGVNGVLATNFAGGNATENALTVNPATGDIFVSGKAGNNLSLFSLDALLPNNRLTVSNVAPTLSFISDQTLSQDQTLSITGTFTDPGINDTHTATIDWGDGSAPTNATITESNGSGTLAGIHHYTEAGNFTATVILTDNNGGAATGSFGVAVSATSSISIDTSVLASASIQQGVAYTGTLATFTDTNASLTATNYSASISWDGSHTVTCLITGNAGNFTITAPGNTFAYQGPGNAQPTITVTNAYAQATASPIIIVADAPLLLSGSNAFTAVQGQSFDGRTVATLTDLAGLNSVGSDLSASIDWGDNTSASSATLIQAGSPGVYDVQGSHVYTATGSYTIRVSARDSEGATTGLNGIQTATATVGDVLTIKSFIPPAVDIGQVFNNLTVMSFADAAGDNAGISNYTATLSLGDGTSPLVINSAGTVSGPQGASGQIVSDPSGGFDVLVSYAYHQLLTNASFSVTVSDSAGASPITASTNTFSVSSAPLTGGAFIPPVAIAGQAFSNATIFHFSDAAGSDADISSYTATVVLGNGNTVVLSNAGKISGPTEASGQIVADPNGDGFDVLLSYVYGSQLSNGTFSVTVAGAGGVNTDASTDTFSVSPAYQLQASAIPIAASAGKSYDSVLATFSDGNPSLKAADFTWTVQWDSTGDPGDTSSSATYSGSGGVTWDLADQCFQLAVPHIYAAPTDDGPHTVNITISDGYSSTTISTVAQVYAAPAAAPANLQAVSAAGSITLEWGAVQGAIAYNVYRSTYSGGETASMPYASDISTTVADDASAFTFEDDDVIPGVTYYYTVTAVNAAVPPVESQASDEITAIAAAPAISSPQQLTATADADRGGNLLTWDAAASAVSYNIYRSTTSGQEGSTPYVTGVHGNAFYDSDAADGQTYYYTITAVDTTGAESDPSGEAAPSASGALSLSLSTSGNVTVGHGFTLSVSPSGDEAADVSELFVDWGDGQVDDLSGSTFTLNPGHMYADDGSYTIDVLAIANATEAENSVAVQVTNSAPDFTASGNSTYTPGIDYTLDLSPTDSSGPIDSYKINWGDGITTTINGGATQAQHQYSDQDTSDYDITVSAEGPGGLSNGPKTQHITTAALPDASSSGFTGTSSITPAGRQVALHWTPVNGATSYQIVGAGGTVTLGPEATDYTFTDDALLSYAYSISNEAEFSLIPYIGQVQGTAQSVNVHGESSNPAPSYWFNWEIYLDSTYGQDGSQATAPVATDLTQGFTISLKDVGASAGDSFAWVTDGTYGSVRLSGSTLVYVPTSSDGHGLPQTDSFQYRLSGSEQTGTVKIIFERRAFPLQVSGQPYAFLLGLTADENPNGAAAPAQILNEPQNGTFTLVKTITTPFSNGAGSTYYQHIGYYQYTPNAGSTGLDWITTSDGTLFVDPAQALNTNAFPTVYAGGSYDVILGDTRDANPDGTVPVEIAAGPQNGSFTFVKTLTVAHTSLDYPTYYEHQAVYRYTAFTGSSGPDWVTTNWGTQGFNVKPWNVLIGVDNGDADKDGVPDYADGYNQDGVSDSSYPGEPSDDQSYSSGAYLQLPWVGASGILGANAKIKIEYSASDPAAVVRTGSGTILDPYKYALPDSEGSLRLWRQNGTPNTLGTYLAPGVYDAAALQGCYVQAVKPITASDPQTITISYDVDGDGHFVLLGVANVVADNLTFTVSDPNQANTISGEPDFVPPDTSTDGTPQSHPLVVDDVPVGASGTLAYADVNDSSGAARPHFAKIQLHVPETIDLSSVRFLFNYEGADPMTMVSGVDSQCLRLWTHDSDSALNPNPLIPLSTGQEPGDYVSPDRYYTADQLGLDESHRTIALYVEGLMGNSVGAITVNIVNPDIGNYLLTKSLYFTVVPDAPMNYDASQTQDLVHAASGVGAENPGAGGFFGDFRLAGGDFSVPVNDLSIDGFDETGGYTRTWTNSWISKFGNNVNGKGWISSNQPFLIDATSGIVAVLSGRNALYFDEDTTGGFHVRFFGQETLVHDAAKHQYTLVDSAGDKIAFNDFWSGRVLAERGQMVSYTDANGVETTVTFNTDGSPDANANDYNAGYGQVQSMDRGGANGDIFTYTYLTNVDDPDNVGKIKSISMQVAGTTIRTVKYQYYGSDELGYVNSSGELKRAIYYENDGANDSDIISESYYSYGYCVQSLDGSGYERAKKYLGIDGVGTAADEAFDADLSTVYLPGYWGYGGFYTMIPGFDTAGSSLDIDNLPSNNGLMAAPINLWDFRIDGLGVSANVVAPKNLNEWAYKTTHWLVDGGTETLYLNAVGEVLLDVANGQTVSPANTSAGVSLTGLPESRVFYQYDNAGRLVEIASPAAVSGYDESSMNLLDKESDGTLDLLNSNSGLITKYSYISSGPTQGYLGGISVQQGESGTAIPQEKMTYDTTNANVHPLSSDTVYAIAGDTSGNSARTTTYAYQYSGDRITSIKTTSPIVTTGQNGDGKSHSTYTSYDANGFINGYTDALGHVYTYVYDGATGGLKDQTLNYTDNSGVVPQIISLETKYTLDSLGRAIDSIDPAGHDTHVAYDDVNHKVTTTLYADETKSTDSSVNAPPIMEVWDDWADGMEQTETYASDPSTPLSLTRTYFDTAGRVAYVDKYYNLTGISTTDPSSPGTPWALGMSDPSSANFYRSRTLYDLDTPGDPMAYTGWNFNETVQIDANGTITQTYYDSYGRIARQSVGTVVALGQSQTHIGLPYFSPTLGLDSSQMTLVETDAYDDGYGDGNLISTTLYPNGAAGDQSSNLTTNYFYDWEDRQVGSYSAGQFSYNVLDNLGEVTSARLYTGASIDGSAAVYSLQNFQGVPQPPSPATPSNGTTNSRLLTETDNQYDAQGQVYQSLVQRVNPLDGSLSGSQKSVAYYDANGDLIASHADGSSWNKTFYDGAGRVVGQYTTDGSGGTTYAAASSISNDVVTAQTLTSYDPDSNPFRTNSTARSKSSTAKGAISGSDANTDTSVNYYDLYGRLAATADFGTNGGAAPTDPSSKPTIPSTGAAVQVTKYAYDPAGNANLITGPDGLQTKMTFDALGQVTETISQYGTPGAVTEDDTYDGLGDVLTDTVKTPAADGSVLTSTTTNTYGVTSGSEDSWGLETAHNNINSNDLLASTTDITNGKIVYGYDALGRQIRQLQITGDRLTKTDYTASGTITVTAPDGTVTTQSGAGNIQRTTVTKAGEKPKTTFSALGNNSVSVKGSGLPVTQTSTPNGARQTITQTKSKPKSGASSGGFGGLHFQALSASGTGSSASNSPVSENTVYDYDPNGNLQFITYADGSKDTYVYNGDSLSTLTRPGGIVQTESYDTKGNDSGVSATDSTNSANNVTINVTSIDDQGRWREVSYTDGSSAGGTSTREISYNDLNQLTDSSSGSINGVNTHYDYYDDGDLEDVVVSLGSRVLSGQTYTYDAQGRIDSMQVQENFDNEGVPQVDHTYRYHYQDNTGLLTGITLDGSATAIGFNYDSNTYDLSNITASTDAGTAWSSTYGYNDIDQITSADVTSGSDTLNWKYTYDSALELQTAGASANGSPVSNLQFGYQYDSAGNRIDLGDTNVVNQYQRFTYDKRGDLTDDGVSTYGYNALGQLTSVTPDSPSGNNHKLAMGYDDQGNRVWKTVYTWNGSEWSSPQTTKYAYDGSNLIAEFSVTIDGGTEADTLTKSYAWDVNGLQSITVYNSDGTIARTLLPVADASGNIILLLNTADGSVDATYQYDPYGNLVAASGNTTDSPFLFKGQSGGYTDAESHLTLMGARWYSANEGRFLTRDPIGQDGGENIYEFGNDDPVNECDPSGLDSISLDADTVWWSSDDSSHKIDIGNLGVDSSVKLNPRFGSGFVLLAALVTQSHNYHTKGISNEEFSTTIQNMVDKIKEHFSLPQKTDSIGIFIDGTDTGWNDGGNLPTLFNGYNGAKWYYGGIGNKAEYGGENDISGYPTWTDMLNKAESDVLALHLIYGNKPIDIFGFSRGGAQAVELARRLGARGLSVRFLGLFDPVYSLGQPGQASFLVTSDAESTNGNYVNVVMPGNVEKAVVLYAKHEERVWLPATKFQTNPATKLESFVVPGVHADVGGSSTNNQYFMWMSRWLMANRMRASGVPEDSSVANEAFGKPMNLNPGGYGFERNYLFNYYALIPFNKQQWSAYIKRDLTWVKYPDVIYNYRLFGVDYIWDKTPTGSGSEWTGK